MKVDDVMEHSVVTISPETTYEEAAKIMCKHNYSGLPVVDASGMLVGIVSEKDLFRAIYPSYQEYAANPDGVHDYEAQEDEIENLKKLPVSQFMIRSVLSVDAETPIMAAGGIMLARGVHRLPVLKSGKVLGIVTREDIYSAILRQHFG